MSDRELLERAAKAAGLTVIPYTWGKGTGWDHEGFTLAGSGGMEWNPLDDDGDALRLAVKLGLNPRPSALDGTAECSGQYEPHHYGEVQDQCAATRRAIVRAAAAMAQP